VYVPFRLFVLDTCAWYRGRVTRTRAEDDGDTHVLIRPDAGFGRFLNAGNVRDQHGWLVVEIMPGQRLPVPDIGAHVAVFGTWVLDAAHGWREIHPVWAIRFLDRGITRYDLPPRKPRYDPDTGEVSGPSGGRGGCDLSYPTVCIPPPPPDRDCADVPYRDFKVVGDDPHGFDTDGDGVGCET
jgi:hypothetical protein